MLDFVFFNVSEKFLMRFQLVLESTFLKSLITKEGVFTMLELIIIPIVTGIAATVLSTIVLRYLERKSNDNETHKLKQ